MVSLARQDYVKPVLTLVEIAGRELLGTGPEPPEEGAMPSSIGSDMLTEDIEGY